MRFVLALLFAASTVHALQERTDELVPVSVRVTAVSGGSLYVDHGEDARIAPGDAARFYPDDGASVDAVVRSVARRSSRVELLGGIPPPAIGTAGEVLVPARRLREDAGSGEREQAKAPAPHPPWTHPPESWDQETPLLAPVSSLEPEDRPLRWSGRTYVQLDVSRDDTPAGSRSTFGRAGVDLRWENPFERGGELELDGDLTFRSTSVPFGPDDDETLLRPDRLSYRVGGVRGRPHRWEAGRFLHHELPELGVLDGVEHVHRFESGDRAGFSLGFLPEPDEDLQTGKDLAVSVYYRWVDGAEEDLTVAAGIQKTWHRGEPDRDLLVTTVDWRASERTSVAGSAWADLYDSSDGPKSSGLELTRLHLNANHRFGPRTGAGLFVTHFAYPFLLRDELDTVTAAEIASTEVTRVGISGWRQATDRVRVSARVDSWSDDSDSGGSADARVDLRDVLYERGTVSLGVFTTDGSFTSGTGVRTSASRRFGDGFLRLSWDVSDFEQSDFTGTASSVVQQVARGSWNTALGKSIDLSLYVENRFGDDQDSTAAGFLLQRRFRPGGSR